MAALTRRALGAQAGGGDYVSPVTVLPVVRPGSGPLTSEDVRAPRRRVTVLLDAMR